MIDADLMTTSQRRVMERLAASADERPDVDPTLAAELRHELEAGIEPVLADLPDGQELVVWKSRLSGVFGCEQQFLDGDLGFEFSVPIARGSVAHKAIEIYAGMRDRPDGQQHEVLGSRSRPIPLGLVEAAIERLVRGDKAIGQWLADADEITLAEVRSAANDAVVKFLDCFPALDRSWRPSIEPSIRTRLVAGRVVLQGRPDLTMMWPQADKARRIIIDLKTGGYYASHADDARFYALIETLRHGVPPRLTGTLELDAAELHVDRVDEQVLESAVRRTVDGVVRLVELLHAGHDDAPTLRPGPPCRWCARSDGCDPGQAWLADPTAHGSLLDS